MAGPTWRIVKPLAATNYIVNGSFEKMTVAGTPDSWTLTGTPTLTQDASYQWRGLYALKNVSASGARGCYQDVALSNGSVYIASVWVYVSSGSCNLIAYDYGGTSNAVTATSSGTGWQQLTVTKTAAGGGLRLAILSVTGAAATFYADAVQVEDTNASGIPSTWIGGYEPGCYWYGMPDASIALRDGQSRAGGLPVPMTDYFLGLATFDGAGTPGFGNVSMPFGLIGGEVYQRTIKKARTMTFTGDIVGTSLDNLHYKRRMLFDLLKFDAVTPVQPVKLQYDDGKFNRLEIKGVYDGGLEFNGLMGISEHAAVRMVCHDPLYYDERDTSQTLGYSQSVSNANYIIQRKSGIWSAVGTGMVSGAGVVDAFALGKDGAMYAGGTFSSASGVANTAYLAKWNGSAWSALGTGVNAAVDALAVGPDGSLYAGGHFSAAGGIGSTTQIAKWDGSAWSALGTGMNSYVYALALGPDGSLYAGGNFTLAGGVASTAYIAKWNGSAWSALGTGMNGAVFSLAVGPDGSLYAGGSFTLAGGVASTAYIAKWNGSAWSALGTGITGSYVYALAVGSDGTVYAGGNFSSAGGVTGTAYIAKWNGTAWSALGSGLNLFVYSLCYKNGILYAGGNFTVAGGVTLPDRIAMWNGSIWLPMDVNLPGSSQIYAINFDMQNNLFLGFYTSGTATSAVVTATANSSTKTYPKIIFTGPGTIYQIVNYTTGRAIYFNNLAIQAGERITLDLSPGNITFTSSWRGNILNYILPGSNLDWYIQPGSNNVSAYLVNSTAASSVYMTWKNAYWSFDGVAP